MNLIYPHFQAMRHVGLHVARCLSEIRDVIKPYVSAAEVEQYVINYAKEYGLGCPTYGYKSPMSEVPFPAYCCVSLNEEICHGTPDSDKVFQEADVVKVDVTFTDAEGWHGDSCVTYVVGNHYDEIVNTTFLAMNEGIRAIRVGRPISDIGKAIEDYTTSKGYQVVRDFCGHSIGKVFHGRPSIPHYYDTEIEDSNIILQPGMMFTVEPMVVEGKDTYHIGSNKWVVETADGGYAAQFEHTVGIDEDGSVKIFTLA